MNLLQSLTLISCIHSSYSFSIQPTIVKPSPSSLNEIYFSNHYHTWGLSSSDHGMKKAVSSLMKYNTLDFSSSQLNNRRRNYDFGEDDDDYDDEEKREYEYARVRRRGPRDRYIDDIYEEDDEDDYDEIPRRRPSRVGTFLSDEDDDDEFDLDDMVENMDFSVTIPNPILDNADPDGATDRMGELVPDRVFWRDMSIMGVLIWIWAASSPDSFVGGHDWLTI